MLEGAISQIEWAGRSEIDFLTTDDSIVIEGFSRHGETMAVVVLFVHFQIVTDHILQYFIIAGLIVFAEKSVFDVKNNPAVVIKPD